MFKRKAKIVTVSGGKGGTGKSFVSVNLAVELAKQLPVGVRNEETASNSRVLLFDADYHLSNSHLFLGIKQLSYLDTIVKKPGRIAEFITPTDYGIDLISFGGDDRKINDNELKFNDKILAELEQLEQFYDWIIVDTGAGLNKVIMSQLVFSDRILLIMNPDPSSMLDTYKVLKFLSFEKDRPKMLDICVNKVASVDDAMKSFKRLTDTVNQFGIKIKLYFAGAVYYDKAGFDLCLIKGIPAAAYDVNSHYAQAFDRIIENLKKGTIVKKVDSFFEKVYLENRSS
jgi:flagellar biosynthesis protein FlhG